ncbi:N-6 DNA methylase [Rosistilla oblonga]|uniref:site-specific DNA-methyltransferase (adenine-specific) n=1 Tax=Rosistilla oblonga TaxID=2527990 RepID=A0A518IVV4_9BACT|nr:N-6 DNA methylase [Rosistilla oblonga]QDV57214.1 hypothetical protein Mal33_32180 [Rosistilla oblonga]
MSEADGQKLLKDLDKKLWTAADRLRTNLDASVYKHAVLGLIFLKYVSDAFELRQRALEDQLRDAGHDYYIDPASYSDDEYRETIRQELEVPDYYLEENVFWVPAVARWKTIQENAALPAGTEIEIAGGKKTTYKITSIGKLIDEALTAVEQDNPKLKGVLNKNYTQLQLPAESLTGLIDLIAEIPFQHESLDAKDILGHVYEYFLGQFALAEGKKSGQYDTPKSIINLIVEMLEPFKGRVYYPAMGCIVDRVLRAFTDKDTKKIVSTFHAWKRGPILSPSLGEGRGVGTTTRGGNAEQVGYRDIPGFCKSATLDEIAEHGYVLTPAVATWEPKRWKAMASPSPNRWRAPPASKPLNFTVPSPRSLGQQYVTSQ